MTEFVEIVCVFQVVRGSKMNIGNKKSVLMMISELLRTTKIYARIKNTRQFAIRCLDLRNNK